MPTERTEADIAFIRRATAKELDGIFHALMTDRGAYCKQAVRFMPDGDHPAESPQSSPCCLRVRRGFVTAFLGRLTALPTAPIWPQDA